MLTLPHRRALSGGAWVRDPLYRKAQAVPSLDLDFATTKSLIDRISGQNLITYTRLLTATYVGSDGLIKTAAANEPRFTHNPTTLESLGLLVEEPRSNLLLWSEDFSNASWNSSAGARTVTANNATAPGGASTADKITADGTNASHFVSQSVTLTAQSYALSVFAKKDTEEVFTIRTFTALGGALARFNLTSGIVSGFTSTAASITAFPNGWYRCTMVFTPLAATGGLGLYVGTESPNTGTGSLFLWGAMLEQGAFSTSYIPTTTISATRNADVVSIGGSNFTGFYNQSEGSIYLDGVVSQGLTGFPWGYNVSDGTANNRIGMYQFTDGIYGVVIAGGVSATLDPAVLFTQAPGAALKHAFAVKSSDARAAVNGTLSLAQTNTVMPLVNQLAIGRRVGANIHNGTIKRLTYWPQRLSNTNLQTITA